jgi:hypothetical protein
MAQLLANAASFRDGLLVLHEVLMMLTKFSV